MPAKPGVWKKVTAALTEIETEYNRARGKHGSMRGPHEGYAVILEEVDELWDEIKSNDPVKARKEVVQVAAMALAFLLEVSPWPEDQSGDPRPGDPDVDPDFPR